MKDILLIIIIGFMGMWLFKFYQTNPQFFPYVNRQTIQNFNVNDLYKVPTIETFNTPYGNGIFNETISKQNTNDALNEGIIIDRMIVVYQEFLTILINQSMSQTISPDFRAVLEKDIVSQKTKINILIDLKQKLFLDNTLYTEPIITPVPEPVR